ncbi:O-methylsterigmatocystin oxidoreductase [Lentinula edodes]|uniref:O-methylsterigmatocystin oxidoreductase n=1 Tax=Lentinula edodes TaxID=5353 RepID=A0A1Q3DY76_LENED|nr:O-methylsterigmatocystin oxidoreductase [Lentinula edodes]
MGKEYGGLIYVSSANALIINKAEVAIDLLEKRARIYSDRAVTPIMKLCGADLNLALEPYSDRWRRDRRLFQQVFRQATISRFYPAQHSKINEFLRELLFAPDDFMDHTMALSQRLVYSALYGLDISPGDSLAQKAQNAVGGIGKSLLSGSFPALERFPFLRFMPSWFPGCGFQQVAEQCRKNIKEIDTVPFKLAVTNMENGTGTSPLAELAARKPTEIEAIKAMGTVSYLAAADTTMSSISSFLLAMCLHPDVQNKGQEEIDSVIGKNRLPNLEDRRSLPYVEAIYHPEKFLPERFVDSKFGPFESINNIYAFGFGRRVCAGRYMAENTVWLTVASVLATFTLSKAKDEQGSVVDVPGDYTDEFFCHPKPYRSTITPRSPVARDLILSTTNDP